MYESNPILDRLPEHLRQYIKPQDYEYYSPVDQAVWRYVMRKNVDYLSKVAHDSYLEGLRRTGISIDRIPNMYGMNRILQDIGWAAVAVDGFIPPAAFMEFQAFNVLVIASDIRQLEHIEYTPAPDIIHEGAGHAPIIANPEYAEYLRRFGEIGSKAISSGKDYELYEAVRHLSIIKEAPETPDHEIETAERRIADIQADMGEPSEMARIRNLHWWTVEYGLIGSLEDPKIYGAGLLSSIGESRWCMGDEVERLPYGIEAADRTFDITKPQPQLYVTPDFAHLSQVLEDFADTMSLRRGGMEGVRKLADSRSLGTVELNTGVQVSGVFHDIIEHEGLVAYLRTIGPTALSFHERELVGHGTDVHRDGFGSPVGRLKGINLAIEDMGPRDLRAYHIYEGEWTELEFEGGIHVSGRVVTGTRNLQGKIVLITFEQCTVRHGDSLLFLPEWGPYHMVVGSRVTSAFSGPADLESFDRVTHQLSATPPRREPDSARLALEGLYAKVRALRDSGSAEAERLQEIHERLVQDHPEDWLLTVEVFELARLHGHSDLVDAIRNQSAAFAERYPEKARLLQDGLELADIPTEAGP